MATTVKVAGTPAFCGVTRELRRRSVVCQFSVVSDLSVSVLVNGVGRVSLLTTKFYQWTWGQRKRDPPNMQNCTVLGNTHTYEFLTYRVFR